MQCVAISKICILELTVCYWLDLQYFIKVITRSSEDNSRRVNSQLISVRDAQINEASGWEIIHQPI